MADKNMTVSIEEQEVCINMMRDEKFATIYASDSTYITKLDRLHILLNWIDCVRKALICTLSFKILVEARNIY